MSHGEKNQRIVLFVCRAASGESRRSAEALAGLDNVAVVTTEARDVEELMETADKHGPLERIVTTQETLLETVARANEALGLPGLSVETVQRTLNKSLLKATLEAAGLNTPRYRLASDPTHLRQFAAETGFPIVLKSVAGSGALATFLIRDANDLDRAMESAKGSSQDLLAEQFVSGQELCIDTITIDNEPQFHSICLYQPSILQAVEQPETQWCCLMPREMDRYEAFIEQGLRAVRALSVGNAMTHMEGFIDPAGDAWFTDATLRPAGARIAPMLAFAYDIDPYRAWARVAVDGRFDGPWERRYAVGTIFLRGVGSGAVEQVEGVESVKRDLAELLVETRWPQTGARKSATYTGDGFITVRHRETEAVQEALRRIAQLTKITYSSETQPATETWGQRLQNFRELNRPAWDQF